MAKTTPENEQDPIDPIDSNEAPRVTDEALKQALVTIAASQEHAPIRQIPLAKARIRTPWNPTGDKKIPKLSRVTRLNGFRLKESRLKNDEIRAFNKLKPGKYHRGKWLVIASNDEEGAAIDVYFPNKTAAHRIDFRSTCPNGLLDALNIMVREGETVAV